MARSQRLLELTQVLRRHRRPVSGQALADELHVSLRTIYRDIQTLVGQGAAIDGEAGLGFLLRPGFVLPPLMFSDEELEALVLGLRWVRNAPTPRSSMQPWTRSRRSRRFFPTICATMSKASVLVAFPSRDPDGALDLTPVRGAIRSEQMVMLDYADVKGQHTRRTVWPIALAFFERSRVLAAWCELRRDFRHFRSTASSNCTRPANAIPSAVAFS